MRDCYVGDIGDFVKYALLRAISRRKRLGIAWYLNPDTSPTDDGGHTDYLCRPDEWRHLDPELFDALRLLVKGGDRSVETVQQSGVLDESVFAADPLDIAKVPVQERKRWRRRWFERVRSQFSGCDLVFADPDNGLCADESFRPGQRVSAKRIPLAEATALAEGRTAVIYHHNTRKRGGHKAEIRCWMERIPGCGFAYYWRRWSNRTFFLVNPDPEIERQLTQFAERWNDHGELISVDAEPLRQRRSARLDRAAHDGPDQPDSGCSFREQDVEPAIDPVVEAYKRDIDRTLLRQNLRRSVTERVANLGALQRLAAEARRARGLKRSDS